jgi:putative restriction endonuclease
MQMPDDGQKYELVDGEIVVSPTGYRHSVVGMRIGYLIQRYLDEHPLGGIAGADLGVVFKNGDLRSPDLTFIRNEKIPAGDAQKRFLEVVPDLVVEVLSPSDSMRFVGYKIGEIPGVRRSDRVASRSRTANGDGISVPPIPSGTRLMTRSLPNLSLPDSPVPCTAFSSLNPCLRILFRERLESLFYVGD